MHEQKQHGQTIIRNENDPYSKGEGSSDKARFRKKVPISKLQSYIFFLIWPRQLTAKSQTSKGAQMFFSETK